MKRETEKQKGGGSETWLWSFLFFIFCRMSWTLIRICLLGPFVSALFFFFAFGFFLLRKVGLLMVSCWVNSSACREGVSGEGCGNQGCVQWMAMHQS